MGCKLLIHDNYELHLAIAYLLVVQIASPLKASHLRWLVVHKGMPELALDHSPVCVQLVVEDKFFNFSPTQWNRFKKTLQDLYMYLGL